MQKSFPDLPRVTLKISMVADLSAPEFHLALSSFHSPVVAGATTLPIDLPLTWTSSSAGFAAYQDANQRLKVKSAPGRTSTVCAHNTRSGASPPLIAIRYPVPLV